MVWVEATSKKAALKRDQWQFMVGSLWDKEEQKMMTE